MNDAVHLDRIYKSYDTFPVLKDLSLVLKQGSFTALLGRNGVGKSTLMRILMKLESVDQGTGSVLGMDLEGDTKTFNQTVGYVSEAIEFPSQKKIKSIVSFYPKVYPKWDQSNFNELQKIFGFNHTDKFINLSRGQKMQFVFSLATSIRPKLLLLDEVTAVFDARVRQECMKYLKKMQENGVTILIATNIVSEVHGFADSIALMEDQRIKFHDEIKKIAEEFIKIKAPATEFHEILNNKDCIEVGINADETVSYIISKKILKDYEIPSGWIDHRNITAEDVFKFYITKRTI